VAIHPGDILAGYRVTRLLGRGGMGEVWAGVSDGGSRPQTPGGQGPRDVAIKVLLARAALKPDLVRRFEREARIASAIQSPYVCQLIEVGAAPDGAHLLVFEQLTGESLADRLKREQYLPFSEVGPIIDDVLQGLGAAHEAGVIHRDLKPGNIFLVEQQGGPADPDGDEGGPPPERRERAKILDFGISKLSRRDKNDPTLTAFDATLGSFAYMAPEQVRGAARADERADIYAVGAVAFRALSGRLPFEASTAHVLVALKLERDAPSLAEATGDQWPAGVERFLERALALKRELRFATAGEALEVWRSIQPSAIPRASNTGAPPPYPRPAEVVLPAVPPPAPRPSQAVLPAVPPLAPRPSQAVLPAVPPPAPRPSQPSLPRPPPPPPPLPRTAKAPSGIIPAPTKPVVTVYGARPLAPPVAPPAPVPPPARPPIDSFLPVDDPPTEVDGPPTMTIDNYNPEPLDQAKRRNAGRP
jgi:eukaryotic-like serine/threonine-protein kinase